MTIVAIDLGDYERSVQDAVKRFWLNRETARLQQAEAGHTDQGERSAVTAGRNMDGFVHLIEDVVQRNGPAHVEIALERSLQTLPGYFRPTKQWDVVVWDGANLIAAIELKSQVGPSFGNNTNNRAEEAIGSALDLWTAFRQGAFGDAPKPFVGYLFMLEDAPGSRKPVRNPATHFPLFPEFLDASYAERYNLLCKRLIQEHLYTVASVILSPRTAINSGEYKEMSTMTSLATFLSTLAGHVAAAAARESGIHL